MRRTDREIMRQALEALEASMPVVISPKAHEDLCTALRERLARQEPQCAHGIDRTECGWCKPARREQEPVAWMWADQTVTTDPDRADGTWTPLYTAPQPAQQPLTEEQIALISVECAATHRHDDFDFARAIEAAHGIGEKK